MLREYTYFYLENIYLFLNKTLTPPWKNLTTYWLTTDIYNYSKEFQFLMNNNNKNNKSQKTFSLPRHNRLYQKRK